MVFNIAKFRGKDLAYELSTDSSEIIATCILLEIPATSPLSTLSIVQCKEIIDYLKKE